MLGSIWTSRAGMFSNQEKMNAISNNLANSQTNGYKSVDVSFSETLHENIRGRNGVPFTTDSAIDQGTGSRISATVRNFNQGAFIATGRDTDIAINGEGFFRVIDKDGNAFYTKDGNFSVDANGNFVHSASGMLLDIQGYDKTNLKRPLSISPEGVISSDGKTIGKINLYDFVDRDAMLAKGNNLFAAGMNPKAIDGKMVQGYVEASNVDMGQEMSNMIITQRAYQFTARSITTADEMWQQANNLKG